MKKTIHIEAIKKSGLKIGFIANKIQADRSMLSRWLHGLRGSKINNEQIKRLEQMLNM